MEVSVQTEAAPEELTLIPEAMKAGMAPPLPSLPGDLPSCSVQCRIPLFEDMGSSVTLTALKLAVETLQREKVQAKREGNQWKSMENTTEISLGRGKLRAFGAPTHHLFLPFTDVFAGGVAAEAPGSTEGDLEAQFEYV